MSVTLDSRRDFTLGNLERVAIGGESVRIGAKAGRRMQETRAAFMALLESDRTRFIYGTTSGGGHHASRRIAPEEQRAHAARAVWRIPGWGFGAEAVPERVVRMVLFARLANYIEGHAKSRAEIAERIAAMLDAPMPRLPESGQVGAGEILPLFPRHGRDAGRRLRGRRADGCHQRLSGERSPCRRRRARRGTPLEARHRGVRALDSKRWRPRSTPTIRRSPGPARIGTWRRRCVISRASCAAHRAVDVGPTRRR